MNRVSKKILQIFFILPTLFLAAVCLDTLNVEKVEEFCSCPSTSIQCVMEKGLKFTNGHDDETAINSYTNFDYPILKNFTKNKILSFDHGDTTIFLHCLAQDKENDDDDYDQILNKIIYKKRKKLLQLPWDQEEKRRVFLIFSPLQFFNQRQESHYFKLSKNFLPTSIYFIHFLINGSASTSWTQAQEPGQVVLIRRLFVTNNLENLWTVPVDPKIWQGSRQRPGHQGLFVVDLDSLVHWTWRGIIQFSGQELKVIAQQDKAFTNSVDVQIDNQTGSVIFQSGSSLRVLHDLQYLLNFKYQAIAGLGWMRKSNRTDDNRPTGMGQQLLTGAGDLSISVNTMYDYRAAYLHFLPSQHYTTGQVFYRQPTLLSVKNIFFMPFTTTLWFCFGGLWILILITPIIINYALISKKMDDKPEYKMNKNEKWSQHLIWLAGLISCQGWHVNPSSNQLRIINLVGILTGVLAYTFYTASFLAAIAGSNVYIRKYQDFEIYGFTIFSSPVSMYYPLDFVKFLDSPAGQKLVKNSHRLYTSHVDAMKKLSEINSRQGILTGSDGFMGLAVNTQDYDLATLCQISRMSADHPTRFHDGMVIRKNSFLREPLTFRMTMIIERGLLRRYFDDYDRKANVQCPARQASWTEFNVQECASAFILLLAGQILSLCLFFFVERCDHLFRR